MRVTSVQEIAASFLEQRRRCLELVVHATRGLVAPHRGLISMVRLVLAVSDSWPLYGREGAEHSRRGSGHGGLTHHPPLALAQVQ